MSTAPRTTVPPTTTLAGVPTDAAPTATVNGEPFPLAGPIDVVALVAALLPEFVADGAPRGVAVAINDVVLARGAWATTTLAAGDRVEVVAAVQGG